MKNLKSIGIVEKTIKKKDKTVKERQYYISSLEPEINLFEKSVHGHWGIEIMHWHLDVTFKEDSNKTIEETANKNMSLIIIFQLCFYVLYGIINIIFEKRLSICI